MIVKMIENLENRMEARIEKMQEMFNKALEELKNKQWVMNNTITEMKKYTRRNQYQNNWVRRTDKWDGR